jgi:hypothetical protein
LLRGILSADSFEESFALKFVQQGHIQKPSHLFLVFSERGNEVAPYEAFFSSLLWRQEQRGITRRPHASMIAS